MGPPQNRRSCGVEKLIGILLVIMFITIGLALRAAAVNRLASPAGSETNDLTGVTDVIDAYARTSLLVLLCLVGLFLLGLVYGNVLGVSASP